ncbi:MAG: hypothetical protein GY798_09895 [Hyphomicrobiales bacterium]|nr:hypothetical protein [Hyphomicrobiales bacterium]
MAKRKTTKPPVAGKPPRNPHARVLGSGPFKPKVVKRKDEYRRLPKHPKLLSEDDSSR